MATADSSEGMGMAAQSRALTGRRYKALFVVTWYPDQNHPAAGIFVKRMADAVSRYDDVVVLHCILDPSTAATSRIDIEWDSRAASDTPKVVRVRRRVSRIAPITYFNTVSGVNRAYQEIRRTGFVPEIIHAHVYKAAVPATILGILHSKPVVVTEHSSDFLQNRLTTMHAWFARRTFGRAAVVMPVSRALRSAIEGYGVNAKFKIVPNVIDTGQFYLSQTDKDYSGPFRLLTVASLDSKKGIVFLLEALRALSLRREDWHANIIGGGPMLTKYREIAAEPEFGGRVSFIGRQPPDTVSEYMRTANLFVLSSLHETFSVATAEALACGVPVVATASGGPEDFVQPEHGLLVPPGDAHALCDAIDKMLGELHSYDGQAIADYAYSLFNPEVIGAQIHSAYESICRSE
jgi:L-malate glycosyltransferase